MRLHRPARAAIGCDPLDGSPVCFDLSAGEAAASPLGKLNSKQRRALLNGERVAAALPIKQTLIRTVDTTQWSRWHVERGIPSLLDAELPFPIEEAALAWTLSRAEATVHHALCVAAPDAAISTTLQSLADQGIDPEFLLAPGPALWNDLSRRHRLKAGRHAVLHGAGPHALLILAEDGRIRSCHPCRSDDAPAIRRTVRATFEAPVDVRWMTTGTITTPDAFAQAVDDPTHSRRIALDAKEAAEALPRALAAAARANTPLNLRSGRHQHPAAQRRQRAPQRRAAAVMLLIATALIAASAFSLRTRLLRFRQADQTARRVAREIAGYPVSVRGASAADVISREWAARADPVLLAFHSDSALSLLDQTLPLATECGITVHEFRATPAAVIISGRADGTTAFDALEQKLNSAGLRMATETRTSADGAETRRIRAEVRP